MLSPERIAEMQRWADYWAPRYGPDGGLVPGGGAVMLTELLAEREELLRQAEDLLKALDVSGGIAVKLAEKTERGA